MDRMEEAIRETNFAIVLRPNEATVLYNAACAFCAMKKQPEALEVLKKAWDAGFKDADWARRDPDLALLHGDPVFEKLYPESQAKV
jgi:non-specific serine/threonine protein kinase